MHICKYRSVSMTYICSYKFMYVCLCTPQLHSMCSYVEKQVRDELPPRRERDGTTGLDGQEDTEDQVLGE